MASDVQVSKTLSFWLRHRPEAAGLFLSLEGWSPVDLVLAALERQGLQVDWDRLLHIVETNDKARFELSADCVRIRARQGHSVQVDADWAEATPPNVLYHGTVDRFWASIQNESLKPMKRHHVHLSADRETARQVGMRRGSPTILLVDVGALVAMGRKFYLTSNGVWLVSEVPPEFLTKED